MTGRPCALGQLLRRRAALRCRAAGTPRAAVAWLILGCILSCWPFAARAETPNVVVTIKPIHSLVSYVMEGAGAPILLVEGSASPHSFSLKPSQVRAINDAGVFIRVSERLEPFTGKIVRSLPNGVTLVTLIDAPGINLLQQRHTGAFDPHGHTHTHVEGDADSHIWLDPENAKVIARYVAEVLGKRYPQHAPLFAANAERLSGQIDGLAREIAGELAPLSDKPFVVFHDAYQYFDARFGLDVVGSVTISPDVKPSAKRLVELRKRIRDLKAVCVFAEPLYEPRLVAAVIEDTGARSGTLDPEGMGLVPGTDLYFTLMRNLAAAIKSCLAPAT